VPSRNQIASLENGAHIVVGTPGRVMDLIERGALDISKLQTLVLDEADRMLDMGFYADIVTVVEQCPAQRQTLLFSATYPEGIAQLAQRFMREPQMVQVAAQHSAHKIAQRWYEVPARDKLDVVVQMLAHFRPESTIAFCNTKQQCREAVAALQAQGISALALFGELEQRERDEVLVQFANRSCSVLVATDVAARGLDIANLSAVINIDVTPDPEVHIHRIGRTGRGDAEGLALHLVDMEEMVHVAKIEQLQGRASEWFDVAELTPAPGGALLPPMMTIQLIGGRKEKIRAGDVMGAMCADFGYTREQIGKISVNDFSTYVAVDRRIAAQACAKLNAGRVKGKSVRARVL
jgi:ATP-independent RNA helicase DbpA